jgi:hypothetical protein
MWLWLSVLGTVLLGSFAVATPASATPGAAVFALVPQHYDPSLNATRSYFVAVAGPGTTFVNSVRIRNMGTKSGTALLYAVDATTGQTSGAVYLDRSKPRRGVGSWITLGARSVPLAPGHSQVVPITVHVPAGARPGDHLGGIVAENAALTQSRGGGALQIRIRHLTIAAVEVQVPGNAATRIDVTAVRAGGEHGYQYVYLHLQNQGALTTKPTGQLLISGADGQPVATRSLKLDTFLPGTAIDYPVLLPKAALSPGRYRATVDLTYAASALGYRRADGPAQTISRSFDLTVSSRQYTTVFKGVPPVKAPVRASSHDPSRLPLLLAIVGGLAALLAALALIVFGVRSATRTAPPRHRPPRREPRNPPAKPPST